MMGRRDPCCCCGGELEPEIEAGNICHACASHSLYLMGKPCPVAAKLKERTS